MNYPKRQIGLDLLLEYCFSVHQDYRQEFNKTRSNVANIIERHDLLDSVRRDINDYQRNNMPGNQSDQKGKNGAPK